MAFVGDEPQFKTGEELPGTVYRILRHLATGGMGSVYEVEDTTVGKKYVLKTLHPQLVDREDLARRMKDEARTLARLQHPNIVDVVTAGVTTTSRPMPFYVMERLSGYNLRHYLDKKGSLELVPAYRIAIDVLDALEQAHENGVIHRDVKPENIFLHHNFNGTATTKLLDFGIMRLLDRKMSHTHGKFIGTLRYASPEQIVGGVLGPATDIYSLALVLYEMVAGRGPFDDAGDAYAIGAAHAQKDAPLLSRFRRDVPPALERLVANALAKNPGERPRDCFTFAAELRRLWREEEAVPRSVTAVNPVSMVPDTRSGGGVQTESASQAEPPMPSLQPDTRLDPGSGEAAFAATVASVPPAKTAVSPQRPVAIDRNAETRVNAGQNQTQRLALNGTLVDDNDRALRAMNDPAPLDIPPSGPRGDLVFPRAVSGATSGTGRPLVGEIHSRPPPRSGVNIMLLAVGSAFVGVLVGAGVLVVTKPWARWGKPTQAASTVVSAPSVVTADPTREVAPPPPSPSVSVSVGAVAASSMPAAPPEAPVPAAVTARGTTSAPTGAGPKPKKAAPLSPHDVPMD